MSGEASMHAPPPHAAPPPSTVAAATPPPAPAPTSPLRAAVDHLVAVIRSHIDPGQWGGRDTFDPRLPAFRDWISTTAAVRGVDPLEAAAALSRDPPADIPRDDHVLRRCRIAVGKLVRAHGYAAESSGISSSGTAAGDEAAEGAEDDIARVLEMHAAIAPRGPMPQVYLPPFDPEGPGDGISFTDAIELLTATREILHFYLGITLADLAVGNSAQLHLPPGWYAAHHESGLRGLLRVAVDDLRAVEAIARVCSEKASDAVRVACAAACGAAAEAAHSWFSFTVTAFNFDAPDRASVVGPSKFETPVLRDCRGTDADAVVRHAAEYDWRGRTCLFKAVARGDASFVETLMSFDGGLFAAMALVPDGGTKMLPLHAAMGSKPECVACVHALLSHSPREPFLGSVAQAKALRLAAKQRRVRLARAPEWQVETEARDETISRLHQTQFATAQLAARDDAGNTALMLAIWTGYNATPLMQALLDAGADADLTLPDGCDLPRVIERAAERGGEHSRGGHAPFSRALMERMHAVLARWRMWRRVRIAVAMWASRTVTVEVLEPYEGASRGGGQGVPLWQRPTATASAAARPSGVGGGGSAGRGPTRTTDDGKAGDDGGDGDDGVPEGVQRIAVWQSMPRNVVAIVAELLGTGLDPRAAVTPPLAAPKSSAHTHAVRLAL